MLFSEVAGQNRIKEQLITGVKNKRLSHAILFTGNEGMGGLSIALALSTYLNCVNRTDTDSCGKCDSCNKMKKLIHPDLHFTFPAISDEKLKALSANYILQWREAITQNPYITYFEWLMKLDTGNKQGNIPIEEGREIVKNLTLKAHGGKAKIQIIWMTDSLKDAGNTLLKIIEEPPADTYFFLIAQNTDNVLQTIISRVQLISLPPLTPESISDHLQTFKGIKEDEALKIARNANGDYAIALNLIRNEQKDHEEIFINWLRLCYQGNSFEILQLVEKIAAKGREYQKDFIRYGLRVFRECLLYQNNVQEISYTSDTEKSFLFKFTTVLNSEQIEVFYNHLNKTTYNIEHNANAKIIFFYLSLCFVDIFKHG